MEQDSRYAFSNSLALGNCVQQQMSAICPDNGQSTETVCVPIEPVEDNTPSQRCFPHGRHSSWKGDRCVIYKPEILGCRQNFLRFIYIDMGAEHAHPPWAIGSDTDIPITTLSS